MALTKKISDLRIGTRLDEDLFGPQGKLLLPQGTVISWSHLKDLYAQGLQEVFLQSPETVIDPTSSSRPAGEILKELSDGLGQLLTGVKNGQPLDAGEVSGLVDQLLEVVLNCNNLLGHFRSFQEGLDPIAEHSIGVAALAMQIGLLLDYDEQTLKELGTAALLHDLEKIQVDSDPAHGAKAPAEGQREESFRHPVIGLNQTSKLYGADSRICMGILQHHERMDGSGYPLGRRGNDIPEFARIIAIADLFDSIAYGGTTGRVSEYGAAEELAKLAFGHVDPHICREFLSYLANFYVGNVVRLSTGEIGEVVRIDPSEPTRPLVRVGERYIDLRSSRTVTIEEVVDY